MALLRAEWSFAEAPPDAGAIVDRLRQATGLPLPVRGDPEAPDRVEFAPLHEALLGFEVFASGWRIHGLVPRHPFVWDHLESVMAGFGGRPVPPWRPEPVRPWAVGWTRLTPIERWAMRQPAVFGWRPAAAMLGAAPRRSVA